MAQMNMLGFRRVAFVRAAPFAAFMAMLALRGAAPADGGWGFDVRWLYGAQVLAVSAMLALWWREYGELARQTRPTWLEGLAAITVGLVVFVLWIHLDAPWMRLGFEPAPAFVPLNKAGELDWPLIAARLAGAALLVPVMEELFWRSFLMRWVQSPQFEAVPPRSVGVRAVVVSTFLFVLAHTLWLAAVTNGALGLWVLKTGEWQFW
jgi:uncharacterized protein